MFSLIAAATAIATTWTGVFAVPNPEITPAPVARGEKRQLGDLTSFLGSVFSDVEGYVTSEGGHLYTVLSEDGHSAFTLATGAGGVVTSVAGSVFTVATAAAGSIYEEVTSIGASEFTIITSDGGKAFTLAESGAGVVTTVAGSIFTAATGAIPTKSGAANVLRLGSAGYLSGPVVVALVAVFTGVLAGARLIV